MKTIGMMALLALAEIWSSFVLSVLWNWFAVPLGAVSIGIALAIGLRLVFACLKGLRFMSDSDEKELREQFATRVASVCIWYGVLLVVGWAVHWIAFT